MDERHEHAKRIFLQASNLAGFERVAFIERECGDDAELRAEVESLLVHDDETLTAPSEGEAPAPRRPSEPLPVFQKRLCFTESEHLCVLNCIHIRIRESGPQVSCGPAVKPKLDQAFGS